MLPISSKKGVSAMATDAYEVKRGIIGKPKVAYKCAKCHNDLESDLTDAGKKDICPFCKAAFIVPGQRELNKIQDAKKQKEAEKTRKDEERRAAKAESVRQRAEWLRLQEEEERTRCEEEQRQAEATRDENVRAEGEGDKTKGILGILAAVVVVVATIVFIMVKLGNADKRRR
jgi:DNA-directed RNA polymerase subunit RPC12/RpoP